MSGAPDLAPAVSAFTAIATAESALEGERTKVGELERTLRKARAERDRMQLEEDSASALRLLDGPDAAPIDPARLKAIARLAGDIPAMEAAIGLQQRRIEVAAAQVEKLRPPLVAEVVALANQMQCDASQTARAIVEEFAEPLAIMIASDQLQTALIGERFAVPPGAAAPFNGSIVARLMVASLPDRLRPERFESAVLARAAAEISAPIINQIKGA